jgi:formylmethanofuran dehydrogenase subunit E-like metal-binding protein
MSLEKELRNLKRTLEEEKVAGIRQAEQDRLAEIDRSIQKARLAQQISAEKVEPFFQVVNKVFAEGKGVISQPYYNQESKYLNLYTSLAWNIYNKGSDHECDGISAEILTDSGEVRFSHNRCIKINDPQYDQKVEIILKEILSDPRNHHSHTNDYDSM